MVIGKPFQAQPEKRNVISLLKYTVLALLFVAFVLLCGISETVSVTETVSVQSDDKRNVSASLDTPEPTQIPVQIDSSENETSESRNTSEINPIDYRLPCFDSDDLYTYDMLITDIKETMPATKALSRLLSLAKACRVRIYTR